MGDINFTVEKNVDLNKVVNLDIDKNVDVEVNNDDILATAESDAEAFGPRALAETDAYTYVSGESTSDGEPNPGSVDVLGNTTILDLGDDNFSGFDPETGDGINGPDGVADTIVINFDGDPQVTLPDGTVIPDVDDINGFDALSNLNAPPPANLPDAELPVPDILSITDLNLEQTGNLFDLDGDGVPDEAEYRSTEDWVVDFGERTIVCDEGTSTLDPVTGQLTLTIPEGTLYLAEFVGPDGDDIELQFEAFAEGAPGFFELGEQVFETTGFVFDAESLEEIIGDYAFEASAVFGMCDGGTSDGEAFSYAESTAALDLNGDGGIIPPVETEV